MTYPEVSLSDRVVSLLEGTLRKHADLTKLECAALHDGAAWRIMRSEVVELRTEVVRLWNAHDHLVVRRVPFTTDGASALLLALMLFDRLKTYRAERIVKHFQMSPWTKALSHTTAEGHFHTDINTADVPPTATVIQCLCPDPGAPTHGQLRVARLDDLLISAHRLNDGRLVRFLTQDEVTMVNDTSSVSWVGRIIDGKTIRIHPETLRAGQKRHGNNPADLEDCLELFRRACLENTEPIDLRPGEMLIVSNRRAVHQRSACTVRFLSSRRHFESRKVAVLHALTEPQ